MRFKTLNEPTGIMKKGDEWISPEGHSPPWHRIWNGTAFEDPSNGETDETDETDETEDTSNDEQPPTEDHDDEQGMQAAVSDRDRGEQGTGGELEPEPKQRGKRGKVQSRRKGK